MENDLFNTLKCCLHADGHFAIDSVVLSCGSNCCKACIENYDFRQTSFLCYGCNNDHHRFESYKSPKNRLVDLNTQIFLNDLFEHVDLKLKSIFLELNGKQTV